MTWNARNRDVTPNCQLSIYDGYHDMVIGIIARAYRDSIGKGSDTGALPLERQLQVRLDAVRFFEDGRFERLCYAIGIDNPQGVLDEIKRTEKRIASN